MIPPKDEGNATVSPLGKHIILELMDAKDLNDESLMEMALSEAAKAAGATLLHIHTHRFAPQGVSGIAVLAESHISAHTWPEIGYGAFDIYTCGDCDPEAGARSLAQSFSAGRTNLRRIKRGPVTSDLLKDSPGKLCSETILENNNDPL
jgi:S-adenosylmethionine decarboxylase